MKSALKVLVASVFVIVACSKSGSSPDAPKTLTWSKAQLDTNQAACETTLKDDSIDEAKVKPICTCWVTAIAKDFTPEEADTVINKVRFFIENPGFSDISIKIFDITGAVVRRNLDREGDNVLYWDGKDSKGEFVRGGIYIYQIESGGAMQTGTVVVAK